MDAIQTSLYNDQTDHVYSCAICLPPIARDLVIGIKKLVQAEVGWFGSANSMPHITINTFKSADDFLLIAERILLDFCEKQAAFTVHVVSTEAFSGNGVLYLGFDNTSARTLAKFMLGVNSLFPKSKRILKISKPHLTIARFEEKENMKLVKARLSIPTIDFSFVCDSISIRRFNNVRRQYDIFQTFDLKG